MKRLSYVLFAMAMCAFVAAPAHALLIESLSPGELAKAFDGKDRLSTSMI